MQLSTTARYAITILHYLAQNKPKQFSSAILSQELSISQKYLTKIMTKLTKHGITISNKGKFGGFSIGKNLADITIFDIVVIFDDIDNKRCVLSADIKCEFEQKCILHDKWQKPKCAIDDFFTQTTLEDLISDPNLHEQ